MQEYTFTLTFGEGRRLQGFCRQFLPPAPRVGPKARLPLVLLLVAEFPWFNMYFKVRCLTQPHIMHHKHPRITLSSSPKMGLVRFCTAHVFTSVW